MHPIQEKLLQVASSHNLSGKTFREIGELIGEPHPQKVKHHLLQLEQKGLIEIDRDKGMLRRVSPETQYGTNLIAIPILGAADCGPATLFADENVQGYLRISSRFIPSRKGLYALKAVGNSMNRANIQGKNIEDGDYVIVDGEQRNPQNRDYVISVIDSVCNIKKFIRDDKHNQIILQSESTQDFPPIVIHPEEVEYFVTGKVVQVIKKANS